MITQWEGGELSKLWPLFADYEETLVWSCLQGRMGRAYCPQEPLGGMPMCAQVIVGDFCFFGGDAAAPGAAELAAHLPADSLSGLMILVAPGKWEGLVTGRYGERIRKSTRYTIKKEPGVFDHEKLKGFVNHLPAGYELRRIDRELYERCRGTDWCQDFVSLFSSYEGYRRWGLGFLVLKNGEIAAGASSYSSYEGGIEIEVDTREDERRKGLATACCARLILECEARGLYPSWDAATPVSVALAKKLGYTPGKPYDCFFLEAEGQGRF